MKTLAELVKLVEDGALNAGTVLQDWFVEQDLTMEQASNIIDGLWLGESPMGWSPFPVRSVVKPHMVYDTVQLGWAIPEGLHVRFFRDVAEKTEAETNIHQPRRINVRTAFWCRRICLIGPPLAGSFEFRVNRNQLLTMPIDDLRARGTWGYPLSVKIKDSDDLFGEVTMRAQGLPEARALRVQLHGWLCENLSV